MGYRHYFYKVKKSEVEKVKDMTLDEVIEYAKACEVEVEEGEKYFYFKDRRLLDKVEVFEFGKLYWDDTADRIYSKGAPLFNNEDVQEIVSDYVPYVVGKEGLLEAIKIYEEKILNYYKDLLVDGQDFNLPFGMRIRKEEVKSIDKVVEHIEDKIRSMSYRSIANIDEDEKWCVTGSWEYEHSIFNLVHLLKSIDWDTDTLLFYGW